MNKEVKERRTERMKDLLDDEIKKTRMAHRTKGNATFQCFCTSQTSHRALISYYRHNLFSETSACRSSTIAAATTTTTTTTTTATKTTEKAIIGIRIAITTSSSTTSIASPCGPATATSAATSK